MTRVLATLAVLNICSCDCGPGGATTDPKGLVRYVGRLALPDDQGCTSAVRPFEATWQQCHDFKRRFDATTGKRLVSDFVSTGALRPLPATVELTVLARDGSSTGACSSLTFQTDFEGVLNVSLPGCGTGKPTVVVGRVFLQYAMTSPDFTRTGYVRGLWQDAETLDLLPGTDIRSRPAFNVIDPKTKMVTKRYRMPEFVFLVPIESEPAKTSATPVVNLGTQIFGSGDTVDDFQYFRQVLIGWSNVIELHHRLHDLRVTQFVLRDGWIGLSIGLSSSAGDPAKERVADAAADPKRG